MDNDLEKLKVPVFATFHVASIIGLVSSIIGLFSSCDRSLFQVHVISMLDLPVNEKLICTSKATYKCRDASCASDGESTNRTKKKKIRLIGVCVCVCGVCVCVRVCGEGATACTYAASL